MQTNTTPSYDMSDNPTNCCPRFKSEGWDGQALHFENKLFVRAATRSAFHFPLNMGPVFKKTFAAIESAQADAGDQTIVLSHDPSAWKGEHYFAVTKEVPGQENIKMSGDYVTKVFEGPYKDAKKWDKELTEFAASKGKQAKKNYFFYTTCPVCAKFYGKNYVVGVAEAE